MPLPFHKFARTESIEVCRGCIYLNEVNLIEVVAKCSPKKSYKLQIYFIGSEIFSDELKPDFTSWMSCITTKITYYDYCRLFKRIKGYRKKVWK